jgi:hypothetical protein
MSGENVKIKRLKRVRKGPKTAKKAALYCHLAPFISPLKPSSNTREVT